jgi:hypothetical protein
VQNSIMGNKTGAIVAVFVSILISACGVSPSPAELRTQATIAAAQSSGMVQKANEIERQQIEQRQTAIAAEATRNAPTATPLPLPTSTPAPTATATPEPTNTPRPTETATPLPIVATAAARTVEAQPVNDAPASSLIDTLAKIGLFLFASVVMLASAGALMRMVAKWLSKR